MTDERYTFEQARLRLEEIATEVRKKDVSLEKSLDLLEEGVRLANICTELVDHTDLSESAVAADARIAGAPADEPGIPEAEAADITAEGVAAGQFEQSSPSVGDASAPDATTDGEAAVACAEDAGTSEGAEL